MYNLVLNRRHKVGLFLVLIATGTSLLFEASAKQTAGVMLLGLAATWFFGSLAPRTLGLILSSMACCVGLCLATLPIWKDWESYRRASAINWESYRYDALAEKYGGSAAFDPDAFHANYLAQQAAKSKAEHGPWEKYAPPSGESDKSAPPAAQAEHQKKSGDWFTDNAPQKTAPSFSLKAAISSHRVSSLGGSFLTILGLAAGLFIWRLVK